MPIEAAAVTSTSSFSGAGGGGATILCSHRLILCNRHHFLSLCRPSSSPRPGSRIRTSFLTSEEAFAKPNHHRLRLVFISGAADSTQPASATTADKSIVSDDDFSLAKVSFGIIGLGVGLSLLSYGFGAYFNILPGSEWSAIMLTYGFPLAIIGMALKYAELKPVPCLTYSDAQMMREKCATPILKQVRNDVTRYRYGDEQHLDEALKRIFQYGQGGGIPRRNAPVLQRIREEAKFTSFFGPGITAEVAEGEKDMYEVRLISNTTL